MAIALAARQRKWNCQPQDKITNRVENKHSRALIDEFNNGAKHARRPENFVQIASKIDIIIDKVHSEVNELQEKEGCNFGIKVMHESGSCAEGSKVNEADEFDVLAELKLGVKVTADYISNPGYVKLVAKQPLRYRDSKRWTEITETDDLNGIVLSPEKVRKWLQSTLNRVLIKINDTKETNRFELSLKRLKGPAYCVLVVFQDFKEKVKIDFVPAVPVIISGSPQLFAVTKEKESENFFWRLSFSKVERNYFNFVSKTNEMKIVLMMIYRLIKAEGNQTMKQVSSYVFKTALFHFVTKHSNKEDWTLENIGILYIQFLENLASQFRSYHLNQFFLAPEHEQVRRELSLPNISVKMNVLRPDLSDKTLDNLALHTESLINKAKDHARFS